ncbi:MAG: CPBP family intramembrane glutamic endopeptidase [Phycisphaerae bacterium]
MNITEMFTELFKHISGVLIITASGLIILAVWLLRNSFGTKALKDSQPRRNNMHPLVPVAILMIWMAGTILALSISDRLIGDSGERIKILSGNIIHCISATISIFVMLFIARRSFARRLEGLGFDFRKLPKDILFGFLNLLSAWPLVAAALLFTVAAGRFIFGSDFRIDPHQELQSLSQHTDGVVAFVIFFNAAIITSIFEEMLFRGFLQTAVRSCIIKPWPAILISSAFFAIAHANTAHWPALFLLGACMGYAYEKSGSLFRPIIIHSIFNGLMVLNVMTAG